MIGQFNEVALQKREAGLKNQPLFFILDLSVRRSRLCNNLYVVEAGAFEFPLCFI